MLVFNMIGLMLMEEVEWVFGLCVMVWMGGELKRGQWTPLFMCDGGRTDGQSH